MKNQNARLSKHTIQSQQTFAELKQELISQDLHLYTFDFKQVINGKDESRPLSIEDFWKLAKIKAKKVSLFVDEILSCKVIEPAPLGFIRIISMAGQDVTQASNTPMIHIRERVVIDEASKTLLFFQLETNAEILLFALNQVTEEKEGITFTGHYVYSVDKRSNNSQEQAFMQGSSETLASRLKVMINKMKALGKSGELSELYQQLYTN